MNKTRGFGTPKTPAQLAQDRRDRQSIIRCDKKYGIINSYEMWLADLDWQDAHPNTFRRQTPRRVRRHTEGSRSSAASGDGNDGDPDPERRQPLQLYDQAALADLLRTSKKTVQNLYSKSPWLLPVAIQIPGARGPRWTPQAVQEWFSDRPAHVAKTAPKPAKNKNKVGRPRIALRSAGGAA